MATSAAMTSKPHRTVSPAPSNPRGRPRSEQRSAAVLAAALDEIAERGIAGMAIESVAARAGVSKATIYRRWPDKIALALSALGSLPELVVPDTGVLIDDLRQLRRDLLDVVARSNLAEVLPALLAERRRSGHGDSIRRYVESRSRAFAIVIERAIARGELHSSLSVDLIAHAISSPLAMSVLNREEPLTDDEWTGVIRAFVHGLSIDANARPEAE
ncbi:MAG TPA: TetR/AcrR family transcriptional regulator [Frankiaceae bacterium]|jgi:AcrR family transcriptional regulator|nr:TetR/AcrR family transcriptional regulator [Frankiaceae bacterium]